MKTILLLVMSFSISALCDEVVSKDDPNLYNGKSKKALEAVQLEGGNLANAKNMADHTKTQALDEDRCKREPEIPECVAFLAGKSVNDEGVSSEGDN